MCFFRSPLSPTKVCGWCSSVWFCLSSIHDRFVCCVWRPPGRRARSCNCPFFFVCERECVCLCVHRKKARRRRNRNKLNKGNFGFINFRNLRLGDCDGKGVDLKKGKNGDKRKLNFFHPSISLDEKNSVNKSKEMIFKKMISLFVFFSLDGP